MTSIIVVGASIAGLEAATQAASEGADVLLLERRAGPESDVPPAAVAFDALWTPPSNLLRAEEAHYETIAVRAGERVAKIRAGARLYNRAVLDSLLAERARAAGADIRWGCHDITVARDRTVRWRGGEENPEVLVLADGPQGWAAKFLRNLGDPSELRFGQAWRLRGPQSLRKELEIAFGPLLPGGRSQLNPGRNEALLWAFQRGRAPSRSAAIAGHPALPKSVEKMLVAVGPSRPDPVFALPGRISAKGLLAAGGAGGQGGIELGFDAGTQAGHAAASAVASDDASSRFLFDAYERPWKERWFDGLVRFRDAYNKFTTLSPDAQGRILEPWEKGGLDLHDVAVPARRPGMRRGLAALRTGLRNPRRTRALLHTYRQLKP